MSEGVVTSSNVTSGVAMREKPLAAPAKRFEEVIEKSVAETGKKKIAQVLKESTEIPKLRLGDHVKVDGEEGRVVALAGTASKEVGQPPTQDHVLIRLNSGKEIKRDPRGGHITVIKQNPEFNRTAEAHFKDAETGKKLHQHARHYDSLSKGHEFMARQHDWEGNKDKAAEHRKLSDDNKTASKTALERAAQSPGFQNRYDLASKEKQARQEHKTRTAMSAGKQYTYQHYFKVPFADKDKAKAAGLKWDPQEKKWYQGSESRYHSKNSPKTPWPFSHTYDNAYGKRHDD
jgi:hypothetical protein